MHVFKLIILGTALAASPALSQANPPAKGQGANTRTQTKSAAGPSVRGTDRESSGRVRGVKPRIAQPSARAEGDQTQREVHRHEADNSDLEWPQPIDGAVSDEHRREFRQLQAEYQRELEAIERETRRDLAEARREGKPEKAREKLAKQQRKLAALEQRHAARINRLAARGVPGDGALRIPPAWGLRSSGSVGALDRYENQVHDTPADGGSVVTDDRDQPDGSVSTDPDRPAPIRTPPIIDDGSANPLPGITDRVLDEVLRRLPPARDDARSVDQDTADAVKAILDRMSRSAH